jgi:HIV Tat-specific factor 1
MKEEEFANDERISFSLVSKTHIAVHDDGSEYEWQPDQKRWIPHEEEHDDEDYPGETLGDYGAGSEYDAQSRKRKSGPTDEAEVSCALPA